MAPEQIYIIPKSEHKQFAIKAAEAKVDIRLVGLPGLPENGRAELDPPEGHYALIVTARTRKALKAFSKRLSAH